MTYAMVIGGAECVWDDIRALEEMIGGPWPGIVVAVNDIGCHWPRRLDHWASYHPEKFPAWKERRAANGYPGGYLTWGRHDNRPTDRKIRGWYGGSSGLLGAGVAISLADRTVLCGIPMTKDPHFAESQDHQEGKPWTSGSAHWRVWNRKEYLARLVAGQVRSMSGRTRDLLGAPDALWLRGLHERSD